MLEALGIHYEPDILTIIGLIIAVAFLGSKVFQRFGIPQVVGYIVTGTLLGSSFLNVVPLEIADELTFISEIALGLIGFNIGSHLLFIELRSLGRKHRFHSSVRGFRRFRARYSRRLRRHSELGNRTYLRRYFIRNRSGGYGRRPGLSAL